jgi:DNA helicase-4
MRIHRPHIILRFLRIADWRVRFLEEGMCINGKLWPWKEIRSHEIVGGWIGSSVRISGHQNIMLKGASRFTSKSVLIFLTTANNIHQAHSRISDLLGNDFFVSDQKRRGLLEELKKLVSWPGIENPLPYLNQIPALERQYSRILRYIAGDRTEIDVRNARFVKAEMHRWREWFDKIEKSPLTDEQAVAAVVMEDRNILIAAAGSGKTSTIVAKTAYAIAKGYCAPEQILVLTFNKRIREELQERLSHRLSAAELSNQISVATFNAFGFGCVRRLKKHVRLASWADSQAREIAHLQALINDLARTDQRFAFAIAEFSAVWLESNEREKEEIIAATEAADLQHAMRLLMGRSAPKNSVPTYLALSGITVRSLQELRICNWLSLMGVNFQYERPFDSAYVPGDWGAGYRPDFYYPDVDCWHEHFGINKLGKAPPWMARNGLKNGRTYEDEVVQKRAVLRQSGLNWFETTSADFENANWDKIILENLRGRGLSPVFIGWDEFVNRFTVNQTISKDVVSLSLSCLRHAKSNRISPEQLRFRASKQMDQRSRLFMSVFADIFDAYEKDLRQRDELDFEDMVVLAADAFRENQLRHPFKLILVDEFQDVSNSRAELISAMLSQSPEIQLFSVGDDWQSIYRFAGADITAMTHFADRFGFSAQNYLTKTFRSNQFIADAASQFIMRNPKQIRKSVKAHSIGSKTSIEVVFHSGKAQEFIESELASLAEKSKGAPRKPSVFLLGRYNFLEPGHLPQWKEFYRNTLDIHFQTIHRAKGLEADIVFLLGATNRRGQDFPATIQDDPLLMLFMPERDPMAWAEERRLFYVALTRAKDKVYLLTPEGQASPFVSELLSLAPISCSHFAKNEKVELEDPKLHLRPRPCPACEKGSLIHRVSKFGPFEFCSHRCGYKRNLPATRESKKDMAGRSPMHIR